MVRIKHRYLNLHILSPSPITPSTALTTAPPSKPVHPIQFHPPLPLDPPTLLNHLKSQISHLHGAPTLGLLSSSLKILYLSPATATAIVRVARDHYRILWAAITFTTALPVPGERGGSMGGEGRGVVIRVVRVSGTIRIAEREVVKRARAAIVRARLEGEGEGALERFGGVEREEIGGDGGKGGVGVDFDEEENGSEEEVSDGG